MVVKIKENAKQLADRKCNKQVNLLMIVDRENKHYTAIKNISTLLSNLNEKKQPQYHFCMNCINSFWTASARDKHYGYWGSNDHIKVQMPSDEENLLTFHDGEHVLHLKKIEHEVGVKHHVCSKEFNEPENRKIRDQCHYTGLYWGAADNHGNQCNLK